jgi:hypothetical protein
VACTPLDLLSSREEHARTLHLRVFFFLVFSSLAMPLHNYTCDVCGKKGGVAAMKVKGKWIAACMPCSHTLPDGDHSIGAAAADANDEEQVDAAGADAGAGAAAGAAAAAAAAGAAADDDDDDDDSDEGDDDDDDDAAVDERDKTAIVGGWTDERF